MRHQRYLRLRSCVACILPSGSVNIELIAPTVSPSLPSGSSSSVLPKPGVGSSCQSEHLPTSSYDRFTLLHLNIRGFISHRAELEAHLSILKWPHFVAITETLLNSTVAHKTLSRYQLVSCLGRDVMLFGQDDVVRFTVHISDSDCAEGSWHPLQH